MSADVDYRVSCAEWVGLPHHTRTAAERQMALIIEAGHCPHSHEIIEAPKNATTFDLKALAR